MIINLNPNKEMKGYDKIKNILDYLHLNTLTFSKDIGVNAQQIYDIKSGKILNISAKLAAKIVAKYPQININWLLTGEGAMLAGEAPSRQVGQTNSGGDNISATHSTVNTAAAAADTLRAQQRQISDLMEMVKTAQQLLEKEQRHVATLADTNSRQTDQISELAKVIATLTKERP